MKFKSEFIFAIGLFVLILSAISLILNHQGFALRLLYISFWILTLATVCYLWETAKDK